MNEKYILKAGEKIWEVLRATPTYGFYDWQYTTDETDQEVTYEFYWDEMTLGYIRTLGEQILILQDFKPVLKPGIHDNAVTNQIMLSLTVPYRNIEIEGKKQFSLGGQLNKTYTLKDLFK